MLTIQGKISLKTVETLIGNSKTANNEMWFFVDYAKEQINLNTKFDVLLIGDEQELLSNSGSLNIKLKQCINQFGHRLKAVPQGYKTICKFEFSPAIPLPLKKIKTLKEWDYNPNAISIASHKEIKLATPDNLSKELYLLSLFYFKTLTPKKQPFSIDDILKRIENDYHPDKENIKIIINRLSQLGRITKKENDEIELVDA